MTSLTGPFLTDLKLQIALISLKGMVSKATIVPPDVTPDCIHHQSGLPYSLRTHSYPFACLLMSFDRPSTFDPTNTQWKALTKGTFDGIRCCFGQLVWCCLKSAGKRTLEPNMAPGLFMGWRIDPGMRYPTGTMDYQSFRTNGAIAIHDVPEPELFVEEGDPVFPIAAAADRALRTGEGEAPEYAIRDVPFIPEGIPAPSTPSGFRPRSVCITVERTSRAGEAGGRKFQSYKNYSYLSLSCLDYCSLFLPFHGFFFFFHSFFISFLPSFFPSFLLSFFLSFFLSFIFFSFFSFFLISFFVLLAFVFFFFFSLSLYLPIYLPTYLFIYLSIYLSIHPFSIDL